MKKQLCLFLAFYALMISMSHSQDKTPLNIKTGCVFGNCENGYGTFIYDNGSIFIGNFKNKKFNGSGILYNANGDIYNGDWENSKITGEGIYIFKSGIKYEGEFKEGNKDGFGVYYNSNGSINYAGEWVDNKHGNFPKDKTGCVSGDCANGFGVYIWATGDIYKGNFKNNHLEGEGTFYYPTGDVYDGEFKNTKPDGWGIYYYKNGAHYEGNMKEGVISGFGSFFNSDGTLSHIGNWENGKSTDSVAHISGCIYGDCDNGIGEMIYEDGSKYIGKFTNSIFDSLGRYVSSNGDYFDCLWKKRKQSGYGKFYFSKTGNYYIGQISGSKLNGTGVLFNADGTVNFAGEFEDNEQLAPQQVTPFADAINTLVNDAEEDFKTIRGEKSKDENELYPRPKILIQGCLTCDVFDPEQAPFVYTANIIETTDKDAAINKYNEFLNLLKTNQEKINNGLLTIQELIFNDDAKFDRGQVASVMIPSKKTNEKGEKPLISIEVKIKCTQNTFNKKYTVNLSVEKYSQY